MRHPAYRQATVTNTPHFVRELEAARQCALDAGTVVMERFRAHAEVHFKSPDQPVTEADLTADRLLRERLTGAFPGYGWLSEETADSRDRLACSRVWIIDPIDGTNSFIEGRPEFVISVGLVEEGEPVVGIIYNPATEEMYWAARGGGAFLNGEPIRVAAQRPENEPGIMLVSRSELRRGELLAYEHTWQLLPLGSTAYRMVKIADGTAHVFVSAGIKSEWDVCAAMLIVQEAGGTVQQVDGSALRFNQPVPRLRGVVATNGEAFIPVVTAPREDQERNPRSDEK